MKQELRFKTNINCGGCVARVTPFLNKIQGINNWKVDINNPDRILTVESENILPEQIIEVVRKIGFEIELQSS